MSILRFESSSITYWHAVASQLREGRPLQLQCLLLYQQKLNVRVCRVREPERYHSRRHQLNACPRHRRGIDLDTAQ